MLDIILELLLAAGLVYSFIVISRWHKLSKKYDTIAEDISNVSYDLADVHTALSAGTPIVLVDCCNVDDDLQPVKSYRWFQVPTDFCERN